MHNKRVEVQQQALDAWQKAGKHHSLEIVTGLGKSRIFCEAVKLYPKNAKILFLAEVTDREMELRREQQKWGVEDYKIEFACYQTAYKWEGREFDFVCADEAVDSFTPVYSRFYFNNKIKDLMCLFAYLEKDLIVGVENGKDVSKGEFCNRIAPICFTYSMDQAQVDQTYRKLDIYIIEHNLDDAEKTIKAGNSKNVFYQTEKAAYEYADKVFKKAWAEKIDWNDVKVMMATRKRSDLLYSLPSKVTAVKELLSNLDSKTIVFGNSLEVLKLITPNVISSHNSDQENNLIRKNFDNGSISVIGSFKKLQQGANLTDLDNVIMMGYYSKQKIAIQRTGRLRQNGKTGNLFVLVTKDTQEEKWYKKMFEGMDNLNFIHCKNVGHCLEKLKSEFSEKLF